ncbi:MAG: LexA family protein [Dehalococcoidia bacterium]
MKVISQSKPAAELTYRQSAFLAKVLDVYREAQRPLHYSVIAEQLGLSPSTAYDILKLLEQKGMVKSEYVTPKPTGGPGRSIILFSPTAKTTYLFSRVAGENHNDEQWEDVKAGILASLRRGTDSECNDLLHELVTRMPEAQSPLVHCAEVITALLITLRETRHTFGRRSPVSQLLGTRMSRMGMSMLAGLALGLCLADRRVQQRLSGFHQHMRRYEESLGELSPENLTLLHRFTWDVWKALKRSPEQ